MLTYARFGSLSDLIYFYLYFPTAFFFASNNKWNQTMKWNFKLKYKLFKHELNETMSNNYHQGIKSKPLQDEIHPSKAAPIELLNKTFIFMI